jgi:hypothetical protein
MKKMKKEKLGRKVMTEKERRNSKPVVEKSYIELKF